MPEPNQAAENTHTQRQAIVMGAARREAVFTTVSPRRGVKA